MAAKNKRRTLTGMVTGDKMNKTVSVSVISKVKHPLFKKFVNRTTKVMAHDEKNECKKGDTVSIKETRPLSKKKRWIVTQIVKKGIGEDIVIEDGSENI